MSTANFVMGQTIFGGRVKKNQVRLIYILYHINIH